MAKEEMIKDFSGRIIAFYTYESNGDIRVQDFRAVRYSDITVRAVT